MTYDFCVYGDSIAFGYGNHNISWFDKLYADKNAIKKAHNGEKIADVLKKIKNDHHSYQNLIFAVGINDLLQNNPHSENCSFPEILSIYDTILRIAKAKAKEVIVQSILPVREKLFPHQDWLDYAMWAYNETIEQFNIDLANLCQKHRVKFIDLYATFMQQNLAELYYDAVHLNDKGQALLKELYSQFQ